MPAKTSAAPSSPPAPPLRAKALPAKPPLPASAPDLVPARMINEALYCERLLYLEWVQGEFSDNRFTVEGKLVHRRADEPSGELPPRPGQAAPQREPGDEEEKPYTARSVWLSSEALGLTAKIDVVQGNESGEVVPIEYKRGKAPEFDGTWFPERAQLTAQVMLLREHGYTCNAAAIYYAGSRRRVPIPIDDSLVALVERTVQRVKEVTSAGQIPPPTQDERKCNGCSLVGICLPDETKVLRGLATGEISEPPEAVQEELPFDTELMGPLTCDPWQLAGTETPAPLARRLHPARDEKMPLYVQEQAAQIVLEGELLIVRRKGGAAVEVRLPMLSQVSLLGNVQMTTQAMRALLERGIPVTYFSYGGWMYGRARGLSSKNVDLRVAQVRAATDAAFCLRMARGLVVSKVKNCRTMLRRNATGVEGKVLSELDQLAYKAERAESLESLLGLEGTAARTYFGEFSRMLKAKVEPPFELEGRNRRPPRDPVNAMLSLAYSLLTKDFAVTLDTVGLDPMLGFYHQTRFGRPSLALDLMEEFRPIVADSVVIGVANNGVLVPEDFVVAAAGVAIAPSGRKKFIEAYERRMDQLVTHPVFGYRISYRRVLEVQARLLGRLLLGETDGYPSFRTR
jgi:CRISPR-associated protein Cas1